MMMQRRLYRCAQKRATGYLAFHSLPNIFYILRKSHSETDRRKLLKKLCLILKVAGASHDRACEAIDNNEFSDFEDCLQDECAQEVSANYIVTRNTEDFQYAKVKTVTPQEFHSMIESKK